LFLGITKTLLRYAIPSFFLPFGAIALATLLLTSTENRRLARLTATRQGESICTFARSFDCRVVDTWIIRAVFEELQPYCRFGRGLLPLRATDRLDHDLKIDPEDLDDLSQIIAYRTGRSLEWTAQPPLPDSVNTVSDLVLFFNNQPWPTARA
jgi:hypothetical protein